MVRNGGVRVADRASRIVGKPGSPGEAQCCGGLNPGGIDGWVAGKRNPPHVVWYQPGNVSGANLEPQQFENSRERLPLQQGGCMTLAQLGLLLWDDLAAPVIAGILVSIIVSRMDNRK